MRDLSGKNPNGFDIFTKRGYKDFEAKAKPTERSQIM
jgi:hypothetical protein